MRARAAWAALGIAFIVGAVAFLMMEVVESEVLGRYSWIVGKRIAGNQDLPAEPRNVLGGVGKNIPILAHPQKYRIFRPS